MYAKEVLLQKSAKNLSLQKKLGEATLLTSLHNNKSRSILGSDDESEVERAPSMNDPKSNQALPQDSVKDTNESNLRMSVHEQQSQPSQQSQIVSSFKERSFPNYPKTKKTGKPYGQIKFSRFLLPGSDEEFKHIEFNHKKKKTEVVSQETHVTASRSRILPGVAMSKYDILKDNQKLLVPKTTVTYFLGNPNSVSQDTRSPFQQTGGLGSADSFPIGGFRSSSIRIRRKPANRGQIYENEIQQFHWNIKKNYELITDKQINLLREEPDAKFDKLTRLERVKKQSFDGQAELTQLAPQWTDVHGPAASAARLYKPYLRSVFSNSLAMPAQQFYQSELKDLPALRRLPSGCFESAVSFHSRPTGTHRMVPAGRGLRVVQSNANLHTHTSGKFPLPLSQSQVQQEDTTHQQQQNTGFFSSIKSTPYLLC